MRHMFPGAHTRDALHPARQDARAAREGGAARDAGEVSPPPVFRYRRLSIQAGQGRGGLGYRFTELSISLAASFKIVLFKGKGLLQFKANVAGRF
jgi:hypothetical protein